MLSADLEKAVKNTAASLGGNPTLPELVDKLVKDKGLKPKDAARTVYVLWKKGQLDISKPNPPNSLFNYFFDLENLWFLALTALVIFTVLTVYTVNTSPLLYLRYALGGVFILLLPGTVLLTVLYPRGGELDGLEKLALSIGLSLAVVPLVGLFLNYTPWGITLTPIIVTLAILVELLGAIAFIRKFHYYKLQLA